MRLSSALAMLLLAGCAPYDPGGGTGGGSGGSGGGSGGSMVAKFTVSSVTGTYSASSTSTRSATVTDHMDNCMASITSGMSMNMPELRRSPSPGIRSAFGATVGVTTATCSGRHVTSTTTDPCTAMGASVTLDNFLMMADVPDWTDSTTVAIELLGLPTGLPSCNYASFVGQFAGKMTTTAPLSSFRGSTAFDLRFTGTDTVRTDPNTSSMWTYDVTVQITPRP